MLMSMRMKKYIQKKKKSKESIFQTKKIANARSKIFEAIMILVCVCLRFKQNASFWPILKLTNSSRDYPIVQ